MIAASLVVVCAIAGQAAEPAAAAPAPAGRRYVLAEPTQARFTVTTNVGVVEGTIDVVRVDARGLDWGAFELWLELDPTTLKARDPVLDTYFARTILRADEGPIVAGSSERVLPRARADAASPEDPRAIARFYLDGRRGGRMVEARIASTIEGDSGRVQLSAQGAPAAFGLPPSTHPFVEITGPLVVELDAPLVRKR